ncbi:TPA: DUF2442 domain-containing protein [Candidatus Sumerlaeota bacterium]|nr:DUF2442 domain-containing protein [Candidatus Sumerlaeota bacterium]
MATVSLIAQSISPEKAGLRILLSNREVCIGWEHCSPLLAHASATERMNAELSPGGYGIHWPLWDEDLSVGALVEKVQ